MNTLTTDQLRNELKKPGNWESLLKLADELLRRLDNAEAQVAAWHRHDREPDATYCPQPHRMMSDERGSDYDPGPSRGNGGFNCGR